MLVRFIPARAGNSFSKYQEIIVYPVHPRACGEQKSPLGPAMRSSGSSPRVRGTEGQGRGQNRLRRFIPARAGNSCPGAAGHRPRTVHPRACGEQTWTLSAPVGQSGSSPRVRGTVGWPPRQRTAPRFIPARAGNRRSRAPLRLHIAVHPRACGEQCDGCPHPSRPRGSSPRVRGTVYHHPANVASSRFIPARAGNSRSMPSSSGNTPVHPRACGEQLPWAVNRTRCIGSSPRVRGTDPSPAAHGIQERFIPARAGNSKPKVNIALGSAVHPRACGEQ